MNRISGESGTSGWCKSVMTVTVEWANGDGDGDGDGVGDDAMTAE